MPPLLFAVLFIAFGCSQETVDSASALYAIDDDPVKQLISFEELMANSREVIVEWQNPDGSSESMTIIEAEIPVPDSVVDLTDEYLQNVYKGNYEPEMIHVDPKMVVVHSIALNDLKTSLTAAGFLHEGMLWNSKWGTAPLGSQFIIEDGEFEAKIYCLVPPKNNNGRNDYRDPEATFLTRRHLGEFNPWAIGIENVVPNPYSDIFAEQEETKSQIWSGLSAKQVLANAKLIRWLAARNMGSIKRLQAHSDFVNPAVADDISETLNIPFNVQYRTSNKWDIGQTKMADIVQQVDRYGYHFLDE